MSSFANSWSGSRHFSKGFSPKKPTAKTDKEYLAYCEKQIKKGKEPNNYTAWCKAQRKRYGLF